MRFLAPSAIGGFASGEWYDFRDLSHAIERLLSWLDDVGPDWLVYVISALIGGAAILTFVGITSIANIWVERRVVARIQVRRGPNRAGPFGLLQPIADSLKLIQKEALTPKLGDPMLFILAPVLVFVPALLTWGVLPFGPGMTFTDLNVGILYIIAISSTATVVIFMGGWASNNKYALLGSMRVIAMLVSYEIPMVLALLGVVIFAGTMSLTGVVQWQSDLRVWMLFLQPLGAIIFLITATAELNRTPADIGEAESEIIAGYHTEYSGMKFGLFYAVELVNSLAVGAILASLYFGGWWLFGLDRWIPSWLVFIGKMYILYFILIWLRGTLPRLRIDQLMAFAWKFLLPLALANVLLTALEVLIWVEHEVSAGVVLPIFAVVNVAMSMGLVVAWTRLMGFRFERMPRRPRLYRELPVVAPIGGGS